MDDGESAPSGRFYVFDRGDIRPAGPDGITITNGPAVNPAGDRIYFTDTSAQKIFVADLAADGAGPARLFADTAAHFPKAFPDGPVVDAEGYVWTALYFGACVARYSPDGALVATVPIPARDITKLAFGGPDLRTAFVTTATKNMGPQDMAERPLSGSLFAFSAPVSGFVQTAARID
jgi:sugar lactone lactonase YvrE